MDAFWVCVCLLVHGPITALTLRAFLALCRQISPADVDGDGLLDLLVSSASYFNGKLGLLRNGYCLPPSPCHMGGVCRSFHYRPK